MQDRCWRDIDKWCQNKPAYASLKVWCNYLLLNKNMFHIFNFSLCIVFQLCFLFTNICTLLGGFEDSTQLDDIEKYRGRLHETLHRHISLNDAFITFYPTMSAKKIKRPVKNMLTRLNRQSRRLVDVWPTICPLPLHDWIHMGQNSKCNRPYWSGHTVSEASRNQISALCRLCRGLVTILGAVPSLH